MLNLEATDWIDSDDVPIVRAMGKKSILRTCGFNMPCRSIFSGKSAGTETIVTWPELAMFFFFFDGCCIFNVP